MNFVFSGDFVGELINSKATKSPVYDLHMVRDTLAVPIYDERAVLYSTVEV